MYSVWYCKPDEPMNRSNAHLFIASVPTYDLADRIAANLEEDGFVDITWVERD